MDYGPFHRLVHRRRRGRDHFRFQYRSGVTHCCDPVWQRHHGHLSGKNCIAVVHDFRVRPKRDRVAQPPLLWRPPQVSRRADHQVYLWRYDERERSPLHISSPQPAKPRRLMRPMLALAPLTAYRAHCCFAPIFHGCAQCQVTPLAFSRLDTCGITPSQRLHHPPKPRQ
jgi:hypothetical protein